MHRATFDEVQRRLGKGSLKREECSRRLLHVFDLARRTNHLHRFVIFGSYVTEKTDPKDVDVILVMDESFRLESCPIESRGLFDHAVAQRRYGASIFWVRPPLLFEETLDNFIAYWQVKRDGSQRGIVEVIL